MRKKNIRNSNQSLVLRGQKHSAHKKKKMFQMAHGNSSTVRVVLYFVTDVDHFEKRAKTSMF